MSYTITITQEDITESLATESNHTQGNYRCSTCPIARAAKRALGRPVYVDGVDVITHFISPFTRRSFVLNRYKMPAVASKFTLDFDNGREVQPFTFSI